jgi:hypothetical protein
MTYRSRSDDRRAIGVASRLPCLMAIGEETQTEAAGDVHLDSRGGRVPDVREQALGLYPQKRLPQTRLSGGSKNMIRAVIGLLTLLLGTLVGKTYAFLAMQVVALSQQLLRSALRQEFSNCEILSQFA